MSALVALFAPMVTVSLLYEPSLKLMLLKAFRNSKRNSRFFVSVNLIFFSMPRSARVKCGPLTINWVNPQSPVDRDRQFRPAGATYLPVGEPPVSPPDRAAVP